MGISDALLIGLLCSELNSESPKGIPLSLSDYSGEGIGCDSALGSGQVPLEYRLCLFGP